MSNSPFTLDTSHTLYTPASFLLHSFIPQPSLSSYNNHSISHAPHSCVSFSTCKQHPTHKTIPISVTRFYISSMSLPSSRAHHVIRMPPPPIPISYVPSPMCHPARITRSSRICKHTFISPCPVKAINGETLFLRIPCNCSYTCNVAYLCFAIPQKHVPKRAPRQTRRASTESLPFTRRARAGSI